MANRTMLFLSAKSAEDLRSTLSCDCPSVITIKTFFALGLEPCLLVKTLLLSKERCNFKTCLHYVVSNGKLGQHNDLLLTIYTEDVSFNLF